MSCIQLGVLAEASDLDPDDGIAVAYRFASPANRAQVGPLERFRRLVHAPTYRAILGHRSSELGTVMRDGPHAFTEISPAKTSLPQGGSASEGAAHEPVPVARSG